MKMTQKTLTFCEVCMASTAVGALIGIFYHLQRLSPFIDKYYAIFPPAFLILLPIFINRKRSRSLDFWDHGAAAYLRSFKVFVQLSLIVLPLLMLYAYGFQKIVHNAHGPAVYGPNKFWLFLPYNLFVVSLPEEFFFRGYVQSALNSVYPKNWKVFGVNIGWSCIITTLIFAFTHNLILMKWYHFSILFIGIFLAYARERTGTITAPILIHTALNIMIAWMPR